MDIQQASELCLNVTCEALTSNNMLLQTQTDESNETNSELKTLTYGWTSDPKTGGSVANALNGVNSDASMQSFIDTWISSPSVANQMGDYSSALIIEAIGKLDSSGVWNSGSGSDSPLQMNALTSFLSVINSDGTNQETPYQTISRNVASSIQQNSGQTSTISQIGSSVNQMNSSTLSILSSPY